MKNCFLLAGLFITLAFVFSPTSGQTQTLDCDALRVLRGNPRSSADPTTHENCVRWPGSSTAVTVYTPVPPATGTGTTHIDPAIVKSAVDKALRVYHANGFMPIREQPPIKVWIVETPPAINADGDTNTLAGGASPCIIHLYESSILDGYDEDYMRQVIAHEVFHCIQASQLGQPYAPATLWWMEGSAEWASAIVMPKTNAEYDSSRAYRQDTILFDQCDPGHRMSLCGESLGHYATVLFFQSMANQKGNYAVFQLLRSMPKSRNALPQYDTFSATRGIDKIFDTFARHYMNRHISDPGGGTMAQPTPHIIKTIEINSGDPITIQGTPLIIWAYKLVFKKGRNYTLSAPGDTGRFTLSYRFDNDTFDDLGAAPIDINTGCFDKTVMVLVTSAENTPDIRDFTLNIERNGDEVDLAKCRQCVCAHPVPQCLKGRWASTESPRWELIRQYLDSGVTSKRGGNFSSAMGNVKMTIDSSDLRLNIAQNGNFTSTNLIKGQGSGNAGGTPMHVTFGFNGAASGHACLDARSQLCLSYKSHSLPSTMTIRAAGMTIPFPLPPHENEGSIAMPYTCTPHRLTITPTMEGNGDVESAQIPLHFSK